MNKTEPIVRNIKPNPYIINVLRVGYFLAMQHMMEVDGRAAKIAAAQRAGAPQRLKDNRTPFELVPSDV